MRRPAAILTSSRASPSRPSSGPVRITEGLRFSRSSATSTPTPRLEILASGLASGPLYAWNADGSPGTGLARGDPGRGHAGAGPALDIGSRAWRSSRRTSAVLSSRTTAQARSFPAGLARAPTTSPARRAWPTWTVTGSTRSSSRKRTGHCMRTGRTGPFSRAGRSAATAGRSVTRRPSATSTATACPRS